MMLLETAAALLLSWEANPAGEHVTAYLVSVERVPANLVELAEVTTIPTTETSLDLSPLPPGDYLASVRAVNVLGWESVPSWPLTVSVPEPEPTAPRPLRFAWVVPIETSYDLETWTAWGEGTITIEVIPARRRQFFRLGRPRPR